MLMRCSLKRRCLWLAIPLVAGHLGCLAIPAATLAVGVPIVLPICGEAIGSRPVAAVAATGMTTVSPSPSP